MRVWIVGILLAVLGCSGPETLLHPLVSVRFPVGITADPGGRYLYVLNSNFDLAYIGGSVSVIDSQTNRLVERTGTGIGVAGYGGLMEVIPAADGRAERLLVTSRDGDDVIPINVDWPDTDQPPTMGCDINGPDGFCTGYSAGVDPFDVAVKPAREGEAGHVFVSAFNGRVSTFRINERSDSAGAALTPLTPQSVDVGAYGLAVHPQTGLAYNTSKFSNSVYTIRVTDAADAPIEQASFDVSRALIVSNGTGGSDFGRGIAFSSAGTRLYVAYRSPPALVVIDTSVGSDGAARNQVVDAIPLATGPASVAVAPAGPNGEDRVLVTMYDRDMVAVIDPASRQVLKQIEVGDGPFDIAVLANDTVLRAYVTLFEENSVAVIELKPGNSQYKEIARIR